MPKNLSELERFHDISLIENIEKLLYSLRYHEAELLVLAEEMGISPEKLMERTEVKLTELMQKSCWRD